MRFVILPSRRVRSMSRNRSYEVPHLSRKIILANMEIWRSKMQPLSGNQRRGLLTSRMDMSLVLRVPREMHLCRSSSTVPRLPSLVEMLQNPHVWLPFDKVQNPLLERPKVDWTWCAFQMFNLSTSRSAPKLWCFYHFHFQMCFAPQQRALSEQLNFQKCSDNEVFWSLYFEMCFAPHQRALFQQPHFQKCYDVSDPTRRIRTRRFSEPTSPAALNNGKAQCFATLPSRALHLLSSFSSLIFFLLLFSSLTLPASAFSSVHILSEVWLLNFLRKPQWFVISSESISWDIASIAKGLFWFSGTTVWTKATQERWQAQVTWLICCVKNQSNAWCCCSHARCIASKRIPSM